MKKIMMICIPVIISVGLMLVVIGNNTNATQMFTDLETLIQNVEQYDGKIIEWSLYAREPVYLSTKEEWLTKKQSLEEQFPNMEWKMSNKADTASIIGFIDHGTFNETIQVLTSFDKNRQLSSYVSYEVKGAYWNLNVENNVAFISNEKIMHLFNKKPIIFSCIKGEFNEELDQVKNDSLDGLLKTFQAKPVESVEEREFSSISAYSSLFAQSLSFTNKQMNMQIGLRKNEMGAGTIIVVGTPILTIEY